MKLNRKQKLFIFFLFFLLAFGIRLLYYSNKSKNPNILLITLDALRPDHLGCYGYNRNTSPNIDKLAKEGVLFTQTISQAPWTGALVSLLTSTYPSTHKVNNWGIILDKRLVTLAEILKKRNYATAYNRSGWIGRYVPGVGRGFDYFFDGSEANEVVEQAINWITELRDRNFFIWIHFFDYPHAPYNPPYPFNCLFEVNKSKHIPIGKGKEFFGAIPEWVAVNNITNVDYYISQYDGEIAFVDNLVGKILDTLKDTNLDRKTIIIITADHGESLGERNIYFQHSNCLYNEEIKVPLIIKGEGIPKGKTIKYPVELIGIMPFLLDILRIKVNINFEGSSFLPFISNKEYSNPAFSEAGVTKIIEGSIADAEQKSIIFGKWKLIYEKSEHGIRYELYNIKADPNEFNNLIDIEKDRFEFLKAKLEKWMNRPKPEITPLAKPLDEETKERLKSLGYLR